MTVVEHRAHVPDGHLDTLRREHAVRLAVSGDLDTTTGPPFALAGQEALTGRSHTSLVIDMGRVTFIDAAGIGALVTIRNTARLNDNVVVVIEPSRCVARLLELTALARTFVSSGATGCHA